MSPPYTSPGRIRTNRLWEKLFPVGDKKHKICKSSSIILTTSKNTIRSRKRYIHNINRSVLLPLANPVHV